MKSPDIMENSGLVDITSEPSEPHEAGELEWVGMDGIDIPVLFHKLTIPARAGIYVDLRDPHVKGIHMSRLYLLLQEKLALANVSVANIRAILRGCLSSHGDLSRQARLQLSFPLTLPRNSLKSALTGWRSYPCVADCVMRLEDKQEICEIKLNFSVTYSSTCPCSAALARQLIQERFVEDFSIAGARPSQVEFKSVWEWLGRESATAATPHGQRSVAEVSVNLKNTGDELPFVFLIEKVEQALQTVVQTAVKREDEQVFAQLSAQNLMFCEDAARKIQRALNGLPEMIGWFSVRARHLESLHAHDAVSVATFSNASDVGVGVEDLPREIPFD